MSQTPRDHLEPLLRELENEIAAAARQARRRALRRTAARYQRSERMLADLLEPECLRAALAERSGPAATWRVLRGLCRHIRFNRHSPFGGPARLMRCEMLAAGEVRILGEQRMARREQAFLGQFFEQMRAAAR